MQGFKKVLVALLVVATILGTMGPVFAAPKDVQGTKYEDAAVRLMALGIFKGDDKGNFNPDMPITRAEATAIIIRALGLEKSAELMKGVTKFADVNADPGLQWATGAINIAVSQGIIKGYPDGRFGGRDNVTYAQLAKMILYALNYGITVEGGVWPTAVLAKADDLGILDGLSVVADAPIVRGEAAKMLDNSLDVKSLKQTGYGDLKQFEETGQTLLEKLGLDEIEGRVVEIPAVASGLDDNEVTIEITKKNGEALKDPETETYTQLQGVDVQSLFGLEVKAWVNDDDEVVFVEKKTSDDDVYYDTISSVDTTNKKVELVVLDDKVAVADGATIYVNYSLADSLSSLSSELYGRFVEKNNKIVFANLFDFSGTGVVTEVDDEIVNYFDKTGSEKRLRLDQADGYKVFDEKGMEIGLDAVKKDTVISWWKNDDNEYFIVAIAKTVKGKVTRVKDAKVYINGTGYDVDGTMSLNNDDDIDAWTVNDAGDFVGEEVVALIDLKGDVRHIRGDVEATSGTQYGIALDAWRGANGAYQIKLFNADGEKVVYALEDDDDYKEITDKFDVVSYELNADGDIEEGTYLVETSIGEKWQGEKTVGKADDKEYLYDGTDRYYLSDSTMIVDLYNDEGKIDPQLIAWEDLKDVTLTGESAIIVGDPGKTAKLVVFTSTDFAAVYEDWFYGVAVDSQWYNGDDWMVTLDVAGAEEVADYVYNPKGIGKGSLVKFKLSGDEIVSQKVVALDDELPTPGEVVSGVAYAYVVQDVDGNYVKLNDKWYRVNKDAVVYDTKLDKVDYVLDQKLDYTDIDEGQTLLFLVDDDDDQVITAAIIYYPEE